MSIYDSTVPVFIQIIESLAAQLDKAAAAATERGYDVSVLLQARLAPDMFPLTSQIRFTCIQATEAIDRLSGRPLTPVAEVSQLEEAKELIARTLSLLRDAQRSEMDAAAERPIEIKLPNGMIFDMTGATFVRDWALPQFYFHAVTAYAILRHNGVPLGKPDYVRHMFAYLRR